PPTSHLFPYTTLFRSIHGNENVIASDIREGIPELMQSGPFEIADATDSQAIRDLVRKYKIEEVYLMAAMLSATAEKYPMRGWELDRKSTRLNSSHVKI